MTDYVKSTNFASKDSLAIGNPLKIVKGTEIDAECNNIAVAVATKADSASVTSNLALKAPLADPIFTGIPSAPPAAVNTNTTPVATTAFVVAQIADDAPTKTGTGASGTWGINITGNAATATSATTATSASTAASATNASTVTTVTTSQVTGATAGASYGSVGTYANLGCSASVLVGNTTSGSNLLKFVYDGTDIIPTSAGLIGTWRNLGPVENLAASSVTIACLWLRIS